MDIDKTHSKPAKLTLITSTEGKTLELRTSSEERKNYFFEKDNNSIKITFGKKTRNLLLYYFTRKRVRTIYYRS